MFFNPYPANVENMVNSLQSQKRVDGIKLVFEELNIL